MASEHAGIFLNSWVLTPGSTIATKTPIIAITTNNSTSVMPRWVLRHAPACPLCGCLQWQAVCHASQSLLVSGQTRLFGVALRYGNFPEP